MKNPFSRNILGYSLLEVMTVIAVLGVVLGLLYSYQDQGWKLFYQSYSRGLSQAKAKLAIRILTDDLREANKSRIAVGRGVSYGIPFPDDVNSNSPYIYFTKPRIFTPTGDILSYDYILYYYAKPPKKKGKINTRKDDEPFSILKSVRFLNQSKSYTENNEIGWPFLPPIIEILKSSLPEDEAYFEMLIEKSGQEITSEYTGITEKAGSQEEFIDHFAKLKRESRNIPVSGNFATKELTDPFSLDEVNIFFGQSYKEDKPIKIKVAIEQPALFFGLMAAKSNFEVKITPRN